MKAYYHLPGLFEFYELYKEFLPLYRKHREYFYDWCDIGSIYGAPADCIWGGGRVGFGEHDPKEVLKLMQEYLRDLPLAIHCLLRSIFLKKNVTNCAGYLI